jgi:ribonucleoside-diphosphate reductase alpha chain
MLSEKAEKIFKMKYAQGDETWEQVCWRVASYIAGAEESEEDQDKYAKRFFQLIYEKAFIPGGRILANAGTGIKNLMNCFALPVDDSRQSIYDTLKNAAEIFAHGGGCGYNFSNVREEGAPIFSTGGKASGPLSFMSMFDQTGEVIQQASRRGAQMGMLDCDHPDVLKFINFKALPNSRNLRLMDEYKRNLAKAKLDRNGTKYFKVLEKTLTDDQLTHFNISVVVKNEFVERAIKGEKWELISRTSGKPVTEVLADEILSQIAQRAWESGDPGVFFYDRANEDNMVPYIGDLRVTNPCGEIPLLPYESCCLGSLNLHRFYDPEINNINYGFLEYAVRTAVRFLDNVQSMSSTPLDEINQMAVGLRRVGLGVMGWADLLAEVEIPYDSDEAVKLAKMLSWFISYFAWLESIALSYERGPFPFYDPEKVDLRVVERILENPRSPFKVDWDELRKVGVRNVSVTSIAPTGTISLLADVNSGIEPYFGLAYKRNITTGVGNTAIDSITEVNPILFRKLRELNLDAGVMQEIKDYVLKHGMLPDLEEIPDRIKAAFRTSHHIPWKYHVDMQAAWQSYVTNSVSKTINCPTETTVDEIKQIFLYMWESGLKGGTIYRNGSKTFQILNIGNA